MSNFIKALFLLIATVYFINCSDRSITPEFKDAGSTLNNLKTTYNCETIEFENWKPDDAKDSTLTVCLINSKALPSIPKENQLEHMKLIATQIKKALKNPELFNSYYVIFVKKEGALFVSRSHTSGVTIRSQDL